MRICGRILSLRPHGKAGFMDLSDGEHRLQVYVRRDFVGPENFELFQLFDLGDIIGVEGTIFRTHTDELTISATASLPSCQESSAACRKNGMGSPTWKHDSASAMSISL